MGVAVRGLRPVEVILLGYKRVEPCKNQSRIFGSGLLPVMPLVVALLILLLQFGSSLSGLAGWHSNTLYAVGPKLVNPVGPDVWHAKSVMCNIIFIKVYKCGSSTNGGVARRIARAYNLGGVSEFLTRHIRDNITLRNPQLCRVHANHIEADEIVPTMYPGGIIPNDTLLYTFIREPGDRAVSWYFYKCVSKGTAGISDKAIIPALSEVRNTIFQYIKPFKTIKDHPEEIHSILQTYDFIGLVERQDESLVVMKLLWGLDLNDILYASSKVSGSYDDQGYYVYPSNLSPTTKAFIANEFRQMNDLDYQLYDQVNQRLDATIKYLEPAFSATLKKFQAMKDKAAQQCHPTPKYDQQTGLQTDPSKRNCLWNDNGCAFECLDTIS